MRSLYSFLLVLTLAIPAIAEDWSSVLADMDSKDQTVALTALERLYSEQAGGEAVWTALVAASLDERKSVADAALAALDALTAREADEHYERVCALLASENLTRAKLGARLLRHWVADFRKMELGLYDIHEGEAIVKGEVAYWSASMTASGRDATVILDHLLRDLHEDQDIQERILDAMVEFGWPQREPDSVCDAIRRLVASTSDQEHLTRLLAIWSQLPSDYRRYHWSPIGDRIDDDSAAIALTCLTYIEEQIFPVLPAQTRTWFQSELESKVEAMPPDVAACANRLLTAMRDYPAWHAARVKAIEESRKESTVVLPLTGWTAGSTKHGNRMTIEAVDDGLRLHAKKGKKYKGVAILDHAFSIDEHRYVELDITPEVGVSVGLALKTGERHRYHETKYLTAGADGKRTLVFDLRTMQVKTKESNWGYGGAIADRDQVRSLQVLMKSENFDSSMIVNEIRLTTEALPELLVEE